VSASRPLPRCGRGCSCRCSGSALGLSAFAGMAAGGSHRRNKFGTSMMTKGRGCYTFCHTAPLLQVRFWRRQPYMLDAGSPIK
jgi:hypothetical protein